MTSLSVVTGAFGYIGRHIARLLLDAGEEVRTVTTHPGRPDPFGGAVKAFPYDFDRPAELEARLRGAKTLYNTYWIRIEHGGATFEQAVRNTVTLLDCAKRAGVERVVHISVTNPSLDSPLPYYRGKALQEQAVRDCGLPYAIVRPTLVFGPEDILVNNMAWLLRRFPAFPIFGSGEYRLQPVHVDDLAELAVESARGSGGRVLDAIGPETFTFESFLRELSARVRPGARFFRCPPSLGIALGRLIGLAVGDVLLTRDELQGLMDGLLCSAQAPNCPTRFTDWLDANKDAVGASYRSELARHFTGPGTA